MHNFKLEVKPLEITNVCIPSPTQAPIKAITDSRSNMIMETPETSCLNITANLWFSAILPNSDMIQAKHQGYMELPRLYEHVRNVYNYPHLNNGSLL